MVEQEAAHVEVQKAAQAAQEAHDLMLQWNKEVDRQRENSLKKHIENLENLRKRQIKHTTSISFH